MSTPLLDVEPAAGLGWAPANGQAPGRFSSLGSPGGGAVERGSGAGGVVIPGSGSVGVRGVGGAPGAACALPAARACVRGAGVGS
ncbi:hypothetical protein [Actinokineospora pegani]|uniref:hypothetical protein n=1 Tax=Actinokineospora pegani TaxID=2654637 RepID=UPI0012EACBEA|nr:hypothetical protein [Actinokineospora pegani]